MKITYNRQFGIAFGFYSGKTFYWPGFVFVRNRNLRAMILVAFGFGKSFHATFNLAKPRGFEIFSATIENPHNPIVAG